MYVSAVAYVFRDAFSAISLGFFPYFSSLFSFLYAVFGTKCNASSQPIAIRVYFLIGVASLILSQITIEANALILSIAGFVSCFANLLIWCVFISKANRNSRYQIINDFYSLCVNLAVFTAILGVVQVAFDRSLFGLASNELYSSDELMATGRFVSRATALMGSAQNYGVFIGAMFCFQSFRASSQGLPGVIKLMILLAGLLVSGSRSASFCAFIALAIRLGRWCAGYKMSHRALLASAAIGLFACSLPFTPLGSFLTDSEPFQRLFDFTNEEAFKVYREALGEIGPLTLLIGNGLGFRSWSVVQLVGESMYYDGFGTVYSSCESYFIQLLLQMGIFGLAGFLGIVISSFTKLVRQGDVAMWSIVLCLVVNMFNTPSFSSFAISYIFAPITVIGLYESRAKGFCPTSSLRKPLLEHRWYGSMAKGFHCNGLLHAVALSGAIAVDSKGDDVGMFSRSATAASGAPCSRLVG